MRILPQTVISATRSGTHQYAVVESIHLGLATVRLGSSGNGARLTNLSIVGNAVAGDTVIVDYSASVPYVRTIQETAISPTSLAGAATPLELPIPSSTDVLDPFSLSSGGTCGMIAKIGASTTFGVPLYTSGGGFYAASAAGIATAKVIALGTGRNEILVDGFAMGGWSFSAGGYLFLASGGGITQTKPTLTDECVVVLGVAITSTLIRFKPELVIVELE